MEIKEFLVDKSDYFLSWESNKLDEIFCSVDLIKTKKYKLISIAKNYIKSIIGEKRITCLSVEFYTVRGFSVEYAKNKISEIQSGNVRKLNKKKKLNPENYKSSSPMTIEFWMNKGFTKEEAKYQIKCCRPVNLEYWMNKGFSKEEAIEHVKNFQRDMSKKFIDKLKENPEKYNSIRPNQKLYWINKGLSEKESKVKVKELQTTFSLDICIEKYGEEEGLLRFNERQEKWNKSLFENFEKYGDGRCIQSKWASDIIDILCDILKIKRPKKEKWISSKKGNLNCSYDFTFNKKIIEFNGDFWHANPKIYDKDFVIPVCNIKASDKWDIDKEKIKLAESHGYEVLVVWESDFIENQELIINKCIKFLV